MKPGSSYGSQLACLFLVCGVMALIPRPAAASPTILYVNQNAPATSLGNGTNWVNAYRELRDALRNPVIPQATAANPVEIWIAKGIYKPTTNADRSASFQLQSNLHLRGGFAGNETSLNHRSAANIAVLSGDIGVPISDPVTPANFLTVAVSATAPPVTGSTNSPGTNAVQIPLDVGYLDNCYNVVSCGPAQNVLLDTLVIANGAALGNRLAVDALDMSIPDDSDPSSTLEGPDYTVMGGGLFIASDDPANPAQVDLENCFFVNNTAGGYGGGIALYNSRLQAGTCTFRGNMANLTGGAIWSWNSHLELAWSSFAGNIATWGGAVACQTSASTNSVETQDLSADQEAQLLSMENYECYSIPKMVYKKVYNNTGALSYPGKALDWIQERISGPKLKLNRQALTDDAGTLESGQLAASDANAAAAEADTAISGEASLYGTSTAGEAMSGAMAAYGYISTGVMVGDMLVIPILVNGYGVSTNSAFVQGWTVFSDGFNEYATPQGWAELAANALSATLPVDVVSQAEQIKLAQMGMYNPNPPSLIIDCDFAANVALSDGGGLLVTHENVQVEGCSFEGNLAANGGGIAASGYTTPVIMSCAFIANAGTGGHSAISSSGHCRSQILNCTLVQNGCAGLGCCIGNETGSEVRICNSILWDNINATNSSGGADVMTATKAILATDTNALALYNSAQGGYVNYIATCDIRNSIVQSLDQLPVGTDIIDLFTEQRAYSDQEIKDIEANLAKAEKTGLLASYGFINVGEGFRPAFKTNGNSSQDPLFVNGITVASTSPAVNAGNNSLISGENIASLTGADVLQQNRFVGSSVDIGAVEFQGIAGSNIVYVSQSATGNGSGSSWANAMTNLQTALSLPNAEIWVAAGTYLPTSGNDRTATFTLADGVRVYGGFVGNETDRSQRSPAANITVLSGNIGNPNSDTDNSYTVVTVYGVSADTILDGFTITKGRGQSGSGISIVGSSLTVSQCTFVDNQSQGDGGAVYAAGTSVSPQIVNCQFINNSAGAGGAIAVYGNLQVSSCSYRGNQASFGGAVCVRSGPVNLYNGLFLSNSATSGGGAVYGRGSQDIGIYNCTFYQNVVTAGGGSQGGGGIDLQTSGSTFTLENCILWQNRVANSSASQEMQQLSATASSALVSYSLIQGLSLYRGQSNLGLDPLFVDPGNGNFTLNAYSPAVDAGANLMGPNYPVQDLAGNSRWINQTVDMGAYEFTGVPQTLSSFLTLSVNCGSSPGPVWVLSVYTGVPSYLTSFQWLVNRQDGNGFVALPPGVTTLYPLGTTSPTLNIANPPASMNGWQYQLVAQPDYLSQPLTLQVTPPVLYVNAAATGTGSGLDWADAFTNLQTALDAAAPCTEVWVAAGTYTPAGISTTNAFHLRPQVQVYGGFAGTETNRSQRYWQTNLTVLNGNQVELGTQLKNVVLADGSAPGVVIDAGAVLDGFTLVGSSGPAIAELQASPTIENCVFIVALGEPPISRNGTPAATPADCLVATIPAFLCNPQAGASFAVSDTTGGAMAFTWQVNSGSGFIPISTAPAYSGLFQIATTLSSSALTLQSIPSGHLADTFQFGVSATGYASPGIRLSYAPPSIIYVNAAAVGLNSGTSWRDAYADIETAVANAGSCVQIWVARGTYAPNTNVASALMLRSGVAVYGGFVGNETNFSQRNWQANPTYLVPSGRNSVVYNNGSQTLIDSSAILDGFYFANGTGSIEVNNQLANPTIQNCIFTNNQSISIYNNGSHPVVTGCQFSGNTAMAIQNFNSAPQIASCIFSNNNNQSTNAGAAVYGSGSALAIRNCQFIGNNSGWGSAVFVTEGSATLDQCVFTGNSAKAGGAAVFTSIGGNVTARNCLFNRNAASFRGGAIAHYGNQLQLFQCTIADNSAFYSAGGVYLAGAAALLENSILWGNWANTSLVLTQQQAQVDSSAGTLGLDSCIIQNLATTAQTNCTAYDPLFAAPAANNYQLSTHSPAIGTGDPSTGNSGTADLAGAPRFVNGRVDRGAYELQEAASSPLSLMAQPAAQSVCAGAQVSFTIAGNPGENYAYQWQTNSGGATFQPASGPQFQITTVSNISTLTISPVPLAFNELQVRVEIGDYFSPAATLSVIAPTVLYVKPHTNGAANGSSWSTAFQTLQDALAAASPCSQIWVAAGTYYLTNAAGAPVSLQMRPVVGIYGGFTGTETNLSQRDWVAHPTTLRAISTAPIINNDGSLALDRSATLDGFVLSGGLNGMINNNVAPTINHCTFEYMAGNAMLNGYQAAPLIENCAFLTNGDSAISSFSSQVTLSNCLFSVNQTSGDGAAVQSTGGALQAVNSQFLLNSAAQAGGAIYAVGCDVALSRCLFQNNLGAEGGAIGTLNGTLSIDNSLFYKNVVYYQGGALNVQAGTNTLVNCTLVENSSLQGAGGGIYLQGGSLQVANSILWNNVATISDYPLESEQVYNAPNAGGSVGISWSCVQGLSAYAGNNNAAFDPVFVNAPGGNFRLSGYSPLLNAGNAALVSNHPLDLAGLSRSNYLNAVDQGAYENQFPPQGATHVLKLPTSQTVCAGSDAVFAIQIVPGGSTNFYWTGHYTNGYVPDHDPTAVIFTNGMLELIIRNVTPLMSGWTFSFDDLVSGYASPNYQLTVAQPGVIYVNATNTSPGQTGSSWTTAFSDLQSALNVASPCTQIWVAQGQYVPTFHNGLQAFSLERGVTVLGGFNGTETNLVQRDWTNHPTLIVGTDAAPAIYNDPHIVPVDSSAVLDGFTVRGSGGNLAMFNAQANATIRNCRFDTNAALAVYNTGSSPLFDTCAFIGNPQGAVYNNVGSPVFTNCSFIGNSSPASGAAMINSLASPLVTRCVFVGNSAGYGGAISDSDANSVFLFCVFSNNAAQFGNGGAYESDGNSTSSLLNCLLANNTAFVGAGAAFGGGSQSMINCTLWGNQASGSYGGGVTVSRGVVSVLNTILWGNSDRSGTGLQGQLYNYGGASLVSNSVVAGWNSGGNNLPYDPLLADPYHGDFHPTDSSAALNLGNTNYDANIGTDLDGNPRIYGPGSGISGVDAGVYQGLFLVGEYSGQSPSPIIQSPQPQAACIGSSVSFTVATAYGSGSGYFSWDYNAGSGWMGLGAGNYPPLGSYTIVESNNFSTVIVSSIVAGMNGYQFRVEPLGFNNSEGRTSPVTLTVNALETMYVNASAPPGGDGASWATAYNDLGLALSQVQSCRRVIWVARGTYPITAQLQVPEATEIYGGFAGGETNLSQRNWRLNQTILSGPTAGPGLSAALAVFGTNPTNDNRTILEGLTVSGGSIGMDINLSSPIISNCTFTNNAYGLYLSGSDAIVDHCQFYGELTNAIQIAGNPVVRYSVFSGNLGGGGVGSAILIISGKPQLINCLLTGNVGSAIDSGGATQVVVDDCTIADNYNPLRPAGIAGNGPPVYVTDSILWGNRWAGASILDSQYTSGNVSTVDTTVEYDGTTAEPLFVNSLGATAAPFTGGDYHLQSCTAAFATNNDGIIALNEGILTDLDGNPRFVNGVLDYGAYEIQTPPGPLLAIASEPVSLTYCSSGTNVFAVVAIGTNLTYRWQRDARDGLGFVALNDGPNFSGAATPQLTVISPPQSFNQQQFRCLVASDTGCRLFSQPAILTVQPTVWFVKAGASPGGAGTSWSNAFATLDAVFTNASLNPCGPNQIWVAAGVYTPRSTLPLTSGMAIYGGFYGTETNLAQRNWLTNTTILQGTNQVLLQANDLYLNPINDTRVDGITFRGASAAISLYTSASGTIANCLFLSNSMPIYIAGSAQTIENCRFLWNTQPTQIGVGGLLGYGAFADFESCWFQANTGCLVAACSFTMNNCVVSGNAAGSTGWPTIWANYLSHPVIANCTISGNDGGGCELDGNGFEVYNSIFWNNSKGGRFDEKSQLSASTTGVALGNDIQNAVTWAVPSNNNTNFSVDPGFVQGIQPTSAPTTNGSFSLSPCSALVDAGLNAHAAGSADVLGQSRLFGGVVDVGAFEFQAPGALPHLSSQSGDQTASFSTPAVFTVSARPILGAILTYQWYGPGGAISGATNSSLVLSNVSPDMNGSQYFCQVMNGACQIASTPATLNYLNVSPTGVGPIAGGNSVALYQPIGFNLGPTLASDSVSSQTIVVEGAESGTIPGAAVVAGNTVTLSPQRFYFPGESVEVSATSSLQTQSGLQAQPYVWDFLASVPNSNSMQFFEQTITTTSAFTAVVVGDFNRDGRLDLLATGPGGAQIWTNDGAGGLLPGQVLTADPVVLARAADLNRDGFLDVILLGGAGKVSIWLNQNGTLANSGTVFGTGVQGFAVADLTGDGFPDVFLAGAGPAQVWLNNGSGFFSDSGQRLGSGGAAIALGDLNGDGAIDAVIAGNAGQTNEIWFNNGRGQFTRGAQSLGVAVGAQQVALGDLNNDGYLDVLLTSSNGPTAGWLNDGRGFFWNLTGDVIRPGDPIYAGTFGHNIGDNAYFPNGHVANAIDNDPTTGFIDVQGYVGFVVQPARGPSFVNAISLTSMQGLTSFGAPYPEIDPQTIEVDGWNGAGGAAQLFYTNLPPFSGGQTLTLSFPNTNAYRYYQVTMSPGNAYNDYVVIAEVALWETNSLPGNISALSLADVNADGTLDACLVQSNGQFAVWNNQGGANFLPSPLNASGVLPAGGGAAIAAGDFDNNGALSFVTVGTGGITLLRNVNLAGPASLPLALPPITFNNTFSAFASNALGAIAFLSQPPVGTLQVNGTPVTLGTTYQPADLGGLQFVPPAYYSGGTVAFNWRGTSANGLVSHTNTMTLGLTKVLYAPVASNYSIQLVRGGSASNFVGGASSVLAADFDPNGGTLAVGLNTPPAHGTLTLNPDGTFVYTHDNTQTATDSFTYLLTCSEGTTNIGTVSIFIDLYTTQPIVSGQSLLTQMGVPLNITLTGSDVDGDVLTFIVSNNPTNGVLSGSPPHLVYTPNPGAFGNDAFTFYANDGLTNSSPATIALFVNAPPATTNLSFTLTNSAPLAITLPGTDPDGDPLTFTVLTPPANGTLSGSAPALTYQPNLNFFGPDGFTFVVADPHGASATGAVSVLVHNTTLLVTNLADNGPATLRQVVGLANSAPSLGPWLIQFAPQLAGGTVWLTNAGDTVLGPSALAAAAGMTIDGTAVPGLSIARASNAPAMRLFRIATNANVTLQNLALSGGLAQGGNGGAGGGGGGGGGGLGGAILNQGVLQLSSAIFLNNQALGGNGGQGGLTLPGGNGGGPNGGAGGPFIPGAPSPGGAAGFGGGGGGGGGVASQGSGGTPGFGGGAGGGGITQPNSSSYGGAGGFGGGGGGGSYGAGGGGAGFGGAVFNDAGTLQITGCTFASNSVAGGSGGNSGSLSGARGSGYGGAIFNYNGLLNLQGSVCTNNTADNGGAIYNLGDGLTSTVLQTNNTLSDLGGGLEETGAGIDNGSSVFVPQLYYTLSLNSRESAILNVFSAGASNRIAGVTQGAIGTVTFTPTAVTYSQTGPLSNRDSFTFTVTNDAGGSYVANVAVSITVVRHPPVAGNVIVSAYRGYPITINPLTNCFDLDGNPLTIVSVAYTPIGVIHPAATNMTYYEDGALADHDSFRYTISDGFSQASATITVEFLPFTLTVTNTADSGPGSLRAALDQVNTPPASTYLQTPPPYGPLWTVQFDPSLAGKTILLSTVGATNFGLSALSFSGGATIDATNAPGLTLALDPAAPPMRLLDVHYVPNAVYYNPVLVLNNVSLRGGIARGQDRLDGGTDGLGGAVLVESGAEFNANHVAFIQNQALGAPGAPGVAAGTGAGGAIFSTNSYHDFRNCVFAGNSARGGAAGSGGPAGQGLGGAMYFVYLYNASITDSQLTNNIADQGGGIYNLDEGNGGDGALYLESDLINNPNGGTNLVSASVGDYTITQIYGSNYIASQSAPSVSSIPDQYMTNQGRIHFTVGTTPGDTNSSVTVYVWDSQTGDPLPDSAMSLTNAGGDYTLTLSLPGACQAEAFGAEVTVIEGNLEYDAFFNLTNFVPLVAPDLSVQTDKLTVLTNITVLTNVCGTFPNLAGFSTNGTMGTVTLNADGSFRYAPVSLQNGVLVEAFPYLQPGQTVTDSFVYAVSDPLGDTATGTIRVAVQGKSPWIGPVPNVTTNSAFSVVLALSPPALGGAYSITATSTNPALVANSSLVISNNVLTVRPTAGQTGIAWITVTVTDTGVSASTSFLLTVPSSSSAPPSIASATMQTNGFHLHWTGAINATYVVLASTDLRNWQALGVGTQTAPGVYDFVDVNTSAYPRRFYRLELAVVAPPTISSGAMQSNGFHLHWMGAINTNYVVLASTDLRNWQAVGMGTQTAPGIYDFVDVDAALYPRRFYRLELAVIAPPTQLRGVLLSGGAFRLQFSGTASSYTVLASTNLVQWTTLGPALPIGTNLFQFTDTAKMPTRFYRVRSP